MTNKMISFVAALFFLATTVNAQMSFDSLLGKLEAGTTVTVTNDRGEKFRGQLLSLSSEAMKISVGGQESVFGVEQVAELKKQVRDPLWNGAVIGAAVGATPLILAAGSGWCEDASGSCMAWGFLYGAIGAAAGVGIDALIMKNSTVFKNEQIKIALKPTIAGPRNGVSLSIRF